jgi:quinol monooxygenase YgiN
VIADDSGHRDRSNTVKTRDIPGLRTGGAGHDCPSALGKGRFGRGQQTADGWPDFIGGRSRVVSLTAEHDRKSDVPVILYAEFTAKPGSESQVQMLISDLAVKVRQEPGNDEFTVYRERDNPGKFFVFEQYLDEASFEAHIRAEYGVIFNRQLSSLIEEGASQLTFLTRSDPP